MNNIIENLHNLAMDLAEEAFVCSIKNEKEKSINLYKKALSFEKKAAMYLKDSIDEEPSRSVLFRSAASLAYNCNDFEEAEKLISFALIGNPPFEIKEELRDLNEQVNFGRHLLVKGVELDQSEIQMSLASGDSVSLGLVNATEFIERSDAVMDIILRTIDRILGKDFLDKRKEPDVIDSFKVYLSVPRAASFAISIKIVKPSNVKGEIVSKVFDDFIDSIETINNKPESLKNKIKDKKYYNHYLHSLKKLAPDGEKVKLVGFTSNKHNGSKDVVFQSTKDVIHKLLINKKKNNEESIKGILIAADEKQKIIRIKTTRNKEIIYYSIMIKKDIETVVKKYWNKIISVKIQKMKGNKYSLKSIIE